MAQSLDVDGRLAEGEPALIDFDTYLAACAALGYQYSGRSFGSCTTPSTAWICGRWIRTAGPWQPRRTLLKTFCYCRTTYLDRGLGIWSGAGGVAAGDFLGRQSGSAQSVVAGLRQAADALAGLRDELSRAVDAKVAAVLAAADQASGHRGSGPLPPMPSSAAVGIRRWPVRSSTNRSSRSSTTVLCGEVLSALARSGDAVAAAYDSALASVDRTVGCVRTARRLRRAGTGRSGRMGCAACDG